MQKDYGSIYQSKLKSRRHMQQFSKRMTLQFLFSHTNHNLPKKKVSHNLFVVPDLYRALAVLKKKTGRYFFLL